MDSSVPPENRYKPLFLSSRPSVDEEKPDDASWGDWTLVANKPLSPRHKELCRLLFLGKTHASIAKQMDISESRVSVLYSNTRVQGEITRLQELAFERTVGERLNDMAPASLDIVEEILTTTDPNVKLPLKKEMAIWVLEKTSGKAKQEIDHTSSTLDKFYNMMNDMQKAGQTLDVTPRIPAPVTDDEMSGPTGSREAGTPHTSDQSKFAAWADENLD